jgi:N-methylhydantoinase B
MISQAENQPVHLGAMPFSVRAAIERYPRDSLEDGDAILLNDPFHGGAHLPDLTLVSPVFVDEELLGFVANRAHHADVGGGQAGGVSASSVDIFQEGIRIPPVKLYEGGEENDDVLEMILANVRTPDERRGDLRAQQAANETGKKRFRELAAKYGVGELTEILSEIKNYSERRMREEISELPDGEYEFRDVLDDDGQGQTDIEIHAVVSVSGSDVLVDFTGSAQQVAGAINAPLAVTASATYYAIRCITDPSIPPNNGCYRPVSISAPSGTIVNAEPPAAVVGGNLETSQRVTDVLLGAFGEVVPSRVIGACQGTMNNITLGGVDPRDDSPYAFYETEGGGFGGRVSGDGMDGVHVHMSNTLNTPAEVLQTAYPLRVRRYALRPDSGGAGAQSGGFGLRRDVEVRSTTACSLLGDGRRHAPYGIAGGEPGARGEDVLIRDGAAEPVPSKTTIDLETGDVISIRTPGGGGCGDPADRDPAAIARDLRLGRLTTAAARERYGIDPAALEE